MPTGPYLTCSECNRTSVVPRQRPGEDTLPLGWTRRDDKQPAAYRCDLCTARASTPTPAKKKP